MDGSCTPSSLARPEEEWGVSLWPHDNVKPSQLASWGVSANANMADKRQDPDNKLSRLVQECRGNVPAHQRIDKPTNDAL